MREFLASGRDRPSVLPTVTPGFAPTRITFRFLVLLAFVSVSASAQLTLSVGSANSTPGGTITLDLTLDDPAQAQPASLQWTLTYPAADIGSITAVAGPAASNASKILTCNTVAANSTCVVAGTDAGPISPGVVARLTFQLTPNPLDTNVPVQLTGVFAAGNYGFGIATSSSDGAINLTGDVALSSLSCNPSTVIGSNSSSCVVTLSANALESGFPVTLGSDNTSATLPSGIVVSAGDSSAVFNVDTAVVSDTQTASISASASGVTKLFAITIFPPVSILSSLGCNPVSVISGGSAACSVSVSPISGSSVGVALRTNNSNLTSLPNISIPPGSSSAAFTVSAGAIGTSQTAVLTATGPGNSLSINIGLVPGSGPPNTVSIWSALNVPGTVTDPDTNAVELGMKFQSDIAGAVTGVRFYKGPSNAGVHTGHLWSSDGSLLAEVVFSNENSTGWQQANFPAPVIIQPKTVYIVSYYSPAGHYSADAHFFMAAVSNGPLHALQNGPGVANGVYTYGPIGFPVQTWQASNYWVDVVFNPAAG